jgi:hypothetical protein
MSSMIPMPIIIYQQQSICPSCHNGEYKIEVCKHCGYKYPQVGYRWYEHLMSAPIVLGVVILIVFLCFFLIATSFKWVDGMPLLRAIADTAKEFWKVLSNIY